MSALAIPFNKDKDAGSTSNGRILKVNNPTFTLDPYHDRLVSMGYEVLEAPSYEEGITLAQQREPELVVVYDDPATGFDALVWLEKQHNSRHGWLAATPLMILADASRLPDLRIEEQPDRVVILQRRADTLNQLARTVRRLLSVNRWD